ncbi:hypothetical protein BT67DRAFT_193061 [Trichocladium antarcticum]|uniref:Uncharacterized protein n=1 Tax=Trichocladium antarcticum TaxID=1450529 RepID=A0AAN6UQJ5_9PEZI|nr:hypothetical protein BT67DRAFT_193061 [Trichocladium antarcticum]
MVSFFGLKVGGKKKKSDDKAAQEREPPQPKRVDHRVDQRVDHRVDQRVDQRADQNAFGEGQFFGRNVHQTGVVNGSIRSVSRAGTPQQRGATRSPYVHDTHNLAAASMFNLSNVGTGPGVSQTSLLLKPHASDMNMRTRFGANNGSSTSLAVPNLRPPGPGFGSRPGTPNGKAKPWVNPLDIHFMRATPAGPATPKSPLTQPAMQLPQTPMTENGDAGSVFGEEEADDMVDTVMTSIKKEGPEAREAREKETELERQKEAARLDLERLERQKSTESKQSVRSPTTPLPETKPYQLPLNSPSLPGPVFKGNVPSRPDSRNGPNDSNSSNSPIRPRPLHQGPPPTGPPTQSLPHPPRQGRQGPLVHPSEGRNARGPWPTGPAMSGGPGPVFRPNGSSSNNPRPHGPHPRSHATGPWGPHSQAPNPHGPSPNNSRPLRLPPLQTFGQRGPGPNGLRSPNLSGFQDHRSQSPAPKSPALRGYRGVGFAEHQYTANDGRNTPTERRGMGPLISTLASPSSVTSPSRSGSGLSLDYEPIEQFARPVIRDVAAKRDTLTITSTRQTSLSMRIEELEKTLVRSQQAHQPQRPLVQEAWRRSTSSSVYSDDINDDDDDDDGPILSIQPASSQPESSQPAPLCIPPPLASALVSANRPQSPFRGPPRRGQGPRRPGLEEYGILSNQVVLGARGPTPAPSSRSGSTDDYSSHSSPPSAVDTPQLRHPNWKREPTQPSPVPTPNHETADRPRPSQRIDTGFKFDFGSAVGAPPTPDSTTWPLSPARDKNTISASPPIPEQSPARAKPADASQGKFTRAHVPPPLNLKFNFSPDAPSRDLAMGIDSSNEAGMWTPPLRPPAPPGDDGRPSTSSGHNGNRSSGLVPSPRLIAQFPRSNTGDESDNRGSWMGIGMARGPSIRELRKPSPSGAAGRRGMVDSFGTGFI